PVKCDPCNTPLVTYQELQEAGVWWLKQGRTSASYTGNLHFTRLHVRYSRDKFPQDLVFHTTPNKERFQGRYIVRHPAPGPYNCSNAINYVKALKERQRKELSELASLTGWSTSEYSNYVYSGPSVESQIADYEAKMKKFNGKSYNVSIGPVQDVEPVDPIIREDKVPPMVEEKIVVTQKKRVEEAEKETAVADSTRTETVAPLPPTENEAPSEQPAPPAESALKETPPKPAPTQNSILPMILLGLGAAGLALFGYSKFFKSKTA
ncbi:MAG: hypothetical protein AAF570_27075, partial [Bacteroidota bacterium]